VENTQKVNVFDFVPVREYHDYLLHTWIRLSKDGSVSRDDEETFAEVGCHLVAFIRRTHRLPDYGEVINWIPEIMGQPL
jgi:hypothetical protein